MLSTPHLMTASGTYGHSAMTPAFLEKAVSTLYVRTFNLDTQRSSYKFAVGGYPGTFPL